MNDLRLWANYYYNMGFNVTHIIPHLNEGKAKNTYKSPTNDRHILKNRRQTIEELNSYEWENSTGIGVVLGFSNLRALDFDFTKSGFERIYPPQPPDYIDKHYFNSFELFVKEVLHLLGLPMDYEWVVKTPNKGFHIIVLAENHNFPIKDNLTKAFTPNDLTYSGTALKSIELRWDKHLVLPPSLNEDVVKYKYMHCNFPTKKPLFIKNEGLIRMLNELCFGYATCGTWGNLEAIENLKINSPDKYNNISKSGYNLHLAHWYETEENSNFLQHYDFGEYLDFSPIYFEKSDPNNDIPEEWLK